MQSPRHNVERRKGDLPRLQKSKAMATIQLRVTVQHNGATGYRYTSHRFDRDLEAVGMGDGYRHHECSVSDRINLKHPGRQRLLAVIAHSWYVFPTGNAGRKWTTMNPRCLAGLHTIQPSGRRGW